VIAGGVDLPLCPQLTVLVGASLLSVARRDGITGRLLRGVSATAWVVAGTGEMEGCNG
jgi:hypothetical protein